MAANIHEPHESLGLFYIVNNKYKIPLLIDKASSEVMVSRNDQVCGG